MQNQFRAVHETTTLHVTGYWVQNIETLEKVTACMFDKRDDDKQLVRPAAKQRARRIAKQMNHRARQGVRL